MTSPGDPAEGDPGLPDFNELDEQARRLPHGPERAALHLRAVESADAAGTLDDRFRLRNELLTSANMGGDPLSAIAAFAWCRARLDEEPERFERFRHNLEWTHKWMPSELRSFPDVPLDRIESVIDDLERRHVAGGKGRRQALGEWLDHYVEIGAASGLIDRTYQEWLASARTSMTDCHACELVLEINVLLALDGQNAALAKLGPAVDGEVRFCSSGPSYLFSRALPLLLEHEDVPRARSVVARLRREVIDRPERIARLARLANTMARAGDDERAVRLLTGQVAHLSSAPSPWNEMTATAAFAGVLVLASAGDPELEVELGEPAPVGLSAGGRRPAPTVAAEWRAHAEGLAARFDARNRSDADSSAVARLADPSPLPPFRLDSPTTPPSFRSPDAGSFAAGSEATRSFDENSAESSAMVEPPPSDPDEFDDWVQRQYDQWLAEVIADAAKAVLADPDAPADLAAGAHLALGTDDLDALTTLADDPCVALTRRVRLRCLAAVVELGRGGEAAVHVGAAERLVADHEATPRAMVAVHRTAAEVLADAGLVDAAREKVAVARAEAEASGDDRLNAGAAMTAIEIEQTLARAGHVTLDDPSIEQTVDSALAVARSSTAGPPAAMLAKAAGGLAFGLRRPETAAACARAALAGLPSARTGGRPVAWFRLHCLYLLADAVAASEGLAEAIEVQREAVAAARSLGDSYALGWARRGLAYQLLDLDRTDEATVLLEEASGLLAEAGDMENATALKISHGRAELDLGYPEVALGIADQAVVEAMLITEDEVRHRRTVAVQEIAALAAERLRRTDEAVARYRQAAEAIREVGYSGAGYLSAAARALAYADRLDEAFDLFDTAAAEARELAAEQAAWYGALVAERRSQVLEDLGGTGDGDDDEAAMAYSREAASGFRFAGDHAAAARAGRRLAGLCLTGEAPDEAITAYEGAIADAEEAGWDTKMIDDLRLDLATALEREGRADEAEKVRSQLAPPSD